MAMLRAAFTSACSAKPHDVHRKVDWLGRLALAMCPQVEQPCEVYAGSTWTRASPARAAL
ncbi:hypothetical protein A6A27_36745 [Micromonospora sp. CB01531]|nr:hypothetical protein A6A27_36745 [Micromonospora sp. CB01531]